MFQLAYVMRRIPTLLLGALALLAACQGTRPLYPTGLYRTAGDFRLHRPALAGFRAGRVPLARKLYVRTAPGEHQKVPLDSLWGYAGADHEAFRVYQRGTYQIEQVDTVVVYSRHKGKNIHYYFSAGLAGPVIQLSSHKLKQAFASNPTFLRLLKQRRWYQSLDATQSPAGAPKAYRLVALYRQSLGLPASAAR